MQQVLITDLAKAMTLNFTYFDKVEEEAGVE